MNGRLGCLVGSVDAKQPDDRLSPSTILLQFSPVHGFLQHALSNANSREFFISIHLLLMILHVGNEDWILGTLFLVPRQYM